MPDLKTKPLHGGAASIANSGPISILCYCASSILMTVTNKYVVNTEGFNMFFVMLFAQSFVCTLCLMVLKSLGYAKYRPLNATDVKSWIPISFLLVLMIFTSAKALRYMPVPIYTIFKNLTIILIAYGEVLFFGGSVTPMELSSFVLMVLSSVVASWGDSQAAKVAETAAGMSLISPEYYWMFLNCICSASFVLIMRMRIKLTNFKDYDTMYYNNMLALPILIAFSLLTEDWSPANVSENFTGDSFTAMVISGLTSVGISYCSGWCVRATSSTTYSMVGALNKLPIALAGLIFFDAPRNFLSILSIFLGFASGLIYAVAKQRKNQK
ncbi:GDP-mannose transporter 1 [Nakaseomyces bracarensis]|uniref:GDP-mannose transporter n=1 Tax=Nakaseomyces bracarensis TaxID=273131 RepID=A0ABR4NSL3_9SACH